MISSSLTLYAILPIGANGSFIHLWTINARGVWKTTTESKVKCIDFSCASEGVSVNVVAAGLENGIIRYYQFFIVIEILNQLYMARIQC